MSITIDAGYPKNNSITLTASPISVTGVTTSAASTMAAIVCGDADNTAFPGTMSGAGLTWTKQAFKYWTAAFVNEGGAEVWTAPSSGALSSQTVTWTPSAGKINVELSVYSISGAAASFVGATGGKEDASGGSSTVDATLTASAAGSLIIAGIMSGNDGLGLTADANTTFDGVLADVTSTTDAVTCHATSLTSGAGSITIGSSTSKPFYASAVLEILAPAGADVLMGQILS